MAGTEVSAERAAILALAGSERNAAEVGANAERDQPVRLAGLRALRKRLGVAKLAQRHGIRRLDLLRGQVADEHRLLAPHGLDRLPRRDLGNVYLGGGERQHVGRRAHLRDQRKRDRDDADSGEAHGRDIEEVAAANAVAAFAVIDTLSRCLRGHAHPLDACLCLPCREAHKRHHPDEDPGAIGGPDSEGFQDRQGADWIRPLRELSQPRLSDLSDRAMHIGP